MKKYKFGIMLCTIGLFFIIMASVIKTCDIMRSETTIGERIPDLEE